MNGAVCHSMLATAICCLFLAAGFLEAADVTAESKLPPQSKAPSNGHYNYRVLPKGCPPLTDGPMLNFVEEMEVPKLRNNSSISMFGCRRVLECTAVSSPPEVNVFWYRNDRLIVATEVRDVTLITEYVQSTDLKEKSLDATPIVGLSQFTSRICIDRFLSAASVDEPRNEFKCSFQSACVASTVIESRPITVHAASIKTQKIARRSVIYQQFRAPLINTMLSSRMELAGKFVQIMCGAVGSPLPQIVWEVLDNEDENVAYPVERFPFVTKLNNGDVLIDTAKTQLASITMRCTAINKYGSDSDTSTLILLKEEED